MRMLNAARRQLPQLNCSSDASKNNPQRHVVVIASEIDAGVLNAHCNVEFIGMHETTVYCS